MGASGPWQLDACPTLNRYLQPNGHTGRRAPLHAPLIRGCPAHQWDPPVKSCKSCCPPILQGFWSTETTRLPSWASSDLSTAKDGQLSRFQATSNEAKVHASFEVHLRGKPPCSNDEANDGRGGASQDKAPLFSKGEHGPGSLASVISVNKVAATNGNGEPPDFGSRGLGWEPSSTQQFPPLGTAAAAAAAKTRGCLDVRLVSFCNQSTKPSRAEAGPKGVTKTTPGRPGDGRGTNGGPELPLSL